MHVLTHSKKSANAIKELYDEIMGTSTITKIVISFTSVHRAYCNDDSRYLYIYFFVQPTLALIGKNKKYATTDYEHKNKTARNTKRF